MNGHVCPQHMYYKPDIWIGQEDCLWLNVYTRDLVIKKKRPVIVWIHGGNFVRGSAADYEPDYILDEDVVLVTIQYRYVNFELMKPFINLTIDGATNLLTTSYDMICLTRFVIPCSCGHTPYVRL